MGPSLCIKSIKIQGKRLSTPKLWQLCWQSHSLPIHLPPCQQLHKDRFPQTSGKYVIISPGQPQAQGPVHQLVNISWLCWSPGDLFQGPALHGVYTDHNRMTWYVHPPSCLPSVMSQKPHKNWVLQTLPAWASHGQEIRLSFLPGSWPSRSCLALLKKS